MAPEQDSPEPPAHVPNYVVDPLERQDTDTLRDVAQWIQARIDHEETLRSDPPTSDDSDPVETVETPTPDDSETTKVQPDSDQFTDNSRDELDQLTDSLPSGTTVNIYSERKDCGPGCKGCPHGPYLYAKYYQDGDTKTEYLGPAAAE